MVFEMRQEEKKRGFEASKNEEHQTPKKLYNKYEVVAYMLSKGVKISAFTWETATIACKLFIT